MEIKLRERNLHDYFAIKIPLMDEYFPQIRNTYLVSSLRNLYTLW